MNPTITAIAVSMLIAIIRTHTPITTIHMPGRRARHAGTSLPGAKAAGRVPGT